MASTAQKAEDFRAAHHQGKPLILPNAWDAASAATYVAAGFHAIATSSGAMSRALGYTDGEGTPADEMFAAIARITTAANRQAGAAQTILVTADSENGYGLPASDLIERLVQAGVAGYNLEDSDPHTRTLVPAEEQAERITTLKRIAEAAGTNLVINARVDVHVRVNGPEETRLERSMARARLYLEAGADCVFPIMLADDAGVAAYVRGVPGPVNIMATHASPNLKRLAEIGVARITFGSGLHRIALEAVESAAARVKAGDNPWPM